nr:hypothetical protein [Tanacetum cinerariifolium]
MLLPLFHVYLFILLCYPLSLYPFTERYAQPYFFSCLIRQMVNTRIDADLSAAVQNALQTLLPQIRAEIREEFRSSGLRCFFRYTMLSIHSIYVMSLYPFTERYAQPYFFSCFIRQVLRRLGSIFTSVYAAVHKLKKDTWFTRREKDCFMSKGIKQSSWEMLLPKLDFQDSPDDEEDIKSSHEYLNDLEEEYQARALLAKSKRFFKNGTQRDEEEVSTNDNDVTEAKALMALNDEERVSRVSTMHVNTEILKENQKIRNELKELTSIKKAWLNSSNKVKQCISEQIPTQKNKILGIDQLTEDTSNFRPKDLVFVKSSADNSKVSITGSNKPKLSKAKDSTLSNHDTGKVPSNESQRNTTDHSVVVSNILATNYDSSDESSVCSTLLPLLKKLTGAEPVFGPNTIKSILKSKSTLKAKNLKGITINEPSSAPARGNKSSLVSKTNSSSAGKLKNVKIEDDPPLATVGVNLEDVILNTNDEVSLLYPEYSNKGVFLCVSDFISKCCIKEEFTRSPIQYKEYLSEFWYSANALDNFKVSFSIPTNGIYRVLGVNTFRKAIGTHYLSHSSDYVDLLSIDIVRPWFSTIRYGEEVSAKGTLKKSLLPPREKVVSYTRFLSLLIMQKMKDGYGDEKPMAFKAPKPSSNAERVPQGTKPGAKLRHKKHLTLKQLPVSSSETSASTIVVAEMHKEDMQATGDPTSLGVTSEAKVNPQLSSGMLAFNLNELIYSTSFIIHSESASGNDASAISTAKADLGIFAPIDFIPQHMNEGTKNNSYDHLLTGTDPYILTEKTKSVSDGLETVLTTPKTGRSNSAKTSEEIKFGAIKLEDLAKLVPNVKVDFKDPNTIEDDPIIVVDDSEEDEEDKNKEIHFTTNDETEDISASTPPSPRSIQLQELKNQVLLL